MKTSVAKALFNSHSYIEYRKIVSDLLSNGLSSGNEQSEKYTNYSKLNETRMNRLDKTMTISDENIQKLQFLKRDYIWLVISEGWCADSAQILPIINKLALHSDKVDLKIVFRDENDDLMNQFLTNGAKAIPKLIIIDKETGTLLDVWGARPAGATQFMKDYKAKNGAIDDTAKADLQMWYLHDKGVSTQNEIVNLMLDLEL
ncbi:MAG TPA: thioredoxin family protein [Flavobacterium sp.]|nr:thioredoxin family protein [Flavobacterium sp.]